MLPVVSRSCDRRLMSVEGLVMGFVRGHMWVTSGEDLVMGLVMGKSYQVRVIG